MNLQRGLNRIGLASGGLIAVICCVPAFLTIPQYLVDSGEHSQFRSLASLPQVTQAVAERSTEIRKVESLRKSLWKDPQSVEEVVKQKVAKFDEDSRLYVIELPLGSVRKVFLRDGDIEDSQAIDAFELSSGSTIRHSKAPEAISYLLLLGLLGFGIPWGGFRLLGWIISGFQASAK